MAIAFARPEYISRSNGANACCKSAYNARTIIKDESSNVTYNFSKRGDNIHHAILLPDGVDSKFKNPITFANEVERLERRKDSQLYVEWVLALPKDENVSLELKQEMIYEFIKRKNWIGEGLGVQVDIHKPHDGEVNWHAHLLVTTRRFLPNELGLESRKAVDLQPEVRFGRVQKTLEIDNNIFWRDVQNDLFKAHGLENRVDLNGEVTQEHIGPIRMRSNINQKQERNYERQIANLELLSSGARVLDRITNHASVFNENDIRRVVSCVPTKETAQNLIAEALSHRDIEELYNESGNSTGFYTTKEVRLEELKLLRLADYVDAQKNVIDVKCQKKAELKSVITKAIERSKKSLSPEQQEALSHILLGTSGMRVLRGRAGTGKSFVLAAVAKIAIDSGINVIGLAPTHKARIDLANNGYTQNDTIKGMLFKLHNGKFYLPQRSLIVVDEAGMIGNDDYLELLRVAAKQRCNVISSGDEKQLTSVKRGGMFEVFAEKYGSKLLYDIKRQDSAWGRNVAIAFASGEAFTGVHILQKENRIAQSLNKESSIELLIRDWVDSPELLSDKIILAVKNEDVDILNTRAREILKGNKTLSGIEFGIKGRSYMRGERILITQTNKDLDLTNGDLAEITYASKEKFTIKVHNTSEGVKEVSFNPSKYHGFSHGYATTVFKSQGASINSVFVFHDGFAGIRNSYVALSRNIKELKLYTNQVATQNLNHLIKQLSTDKEISSSLNYFTKEDLAQKEQLSNSGEKKGLLKMLVSEVASIAYKKLTEVADKHLELASYYNYEVPSITNEQVEVLLDSYIDSERFITSEEAIGESILESGELIAIGGNKPHTQSFASKTKQSSKEWFYNNVDRAKSLVSNQSRKEQLRLEDERLKSEVKFKAEEIAQDILGIPNKRLSNSKTLRFGESGKIAVRINGEASGQWYDFSSSKGGDLFTLVEEYRNCNFKEASDYLRSITGINSNPHLKIAYDHENSDFTKKALDAKESLEKENKAKQQMVSKLNTRSKEIGDKSVARRYLAKRAITCHLSEDIKTTGIYTNEQNKYYPAILVFARNVHGDITGGQQILLDKASYTKANIDIPKRSFGKIAGSFVSVGDITTTNNTKKEEHSSSKSQITVIAEGLETALSVKQALTNSYTQQSVQIKVLCSLGISNISNYPASQNEKIIIAADNDGEHANTRKTIDQATKTLEARGAFVYVVAPSCHGDFNDLLIQEGENSVQLAFKRAINKHSSTTLEQFFTSSTNSQSTAKTETINEHLNKQELEDLKYLQKYDLPESQIVDEYRRGNLSGVLALEKARKSLNVLEKEYEQHSNILGELKNLGYKEVLDKKGVMKSLFGMDKTLVKHHFQEERNRYLSEYIKTHISEFHAQKEAVTDIASMIEVVDKEQTFLKSTFESLNLPIEEYGEKNEKFLQYGEFLSKNPKIVEEVSSLANASIRENIQSEGSLVNLLKNTNDIQVVHTNLDKEIEKHNINNTLLLLSEDKNKAQTPDQIIDLLRKEQDFLSNLDNTMKYPEQSSDTIITLIKQAKQNKQDNVITSLHKLSTYLIEKNLKQPEDVMKVILNANDPVTSHHSLMQDYHHHTISEVNRGLSRIDEGSTALINGKHFDCPIKFLDTLLKTHEHNEFLPKLAIQKIQTKVIEHHKALEMSKDFSGPHL